jgi:hypothetical protein
MSNKIKEQNPIFCTRTIKLEKEKGYGIERTALTKRWTIQSPNVVAKININGAKIDLPTMDGKNFDTNFIRNAVRNLDPCDEQTAEMHSAECTLFGSQLETVPHYTYFPSKYLFDYMFSGTLCITFEPESENGEELPNPILVEEEFILSDKQLEQRINAGEKIEDLRNGCKDMSVSFNS